MNNKIFYYTLRLNKPLTRSFSHEFTPCAVKQVNGIKDPASNEDLNTYSKLFNKNRIPTKLISYQLFTKNKFEEIQNTSPGKENMIEVSRKLSEEWKTIDSAEKLIWEEKAINLKKKLAEDLQDFLVGLKVEDRDALENSRKEQNRNGLELKSKRQKK